MKWGSYINKKNKIIYKRIFAWFPVSFVNGKTVWLESYIDRHEYINDKWVYTSSKIKFTK